MTLGLSLTALEGRERTCAQDRSWELGWKNAKKPEAHRPAPDLHASCFRSDFVLVWGDKTHLHSCAQGKMLQWSCYARLQLEIAKGSVTAVRKIVCGHDLSVISAVRGCSWKLLNALLWLSEERIGLYTDSKLQYGLEKTYSWEKELSEKVVQWRGGLEKRWLREDLASGMGSLMKNSSFLFFVCSQFVLSLVHSFVDSLMHWFPPSLIRFWIFPFHWFFHSNVHSLSHSPTDSFIRGALILSSHWFHLSHFIGIANTVRSHTDAPQNLNVSSLLHFMDSPIGQWFLMVVVFFLFEPCAPARPGTVVVVVVVVAVSSGMRWFVDFFGTTPVGRVLKMGYAFQMFVLVMKKISQCFFWLLCQTNLFVIMVA